MDLYTKHAKLLGSYDAMLHFAIDALKGKTSLTGIELAEFFERRIKEINEEINQNTNTNEHRNTIKGNKEIIESNTEAVAGEI